MLFNFYAILSCFFFFFFIYFVISAVIADIFNPFVELVFFMHVWEY